MRALAVAFCHGRYRDDARAERAEEVLTALLFEAGDLAEGERIGELTEEEAADALRRLARSRLRRRPLDGRRVLWGVDLVGDTLVPFPKEPSAEYLARFAFWRLANAVELREWRRFTLRRCGVSGCRNWFVEGRVVPKGGVKNRCPSCRRLDKRAEER